VSRRAAQLEVKKCVWGVRRNAEVQEAEERE